MKLLLLDQAAEVPRIGRCRAKSLPICTKFRQIAPEQPQDEAEIVSGRAGSAPVLLRPRAGRLSGTVGPLGFGRTAPPACGAS